MGFYNLKIKKEKKYKVFCFSYFFFLFFLYRFLPLFVCCLSFAAPLLISCRYREQGLRHGMYGAAHGGVACSGGARTKGRLLRHAWRLLGFATMYHDIGPFGLNRFAGFRFGLG